jgi:hypothetical protein
MALEKDVIINPTDEFSIRVQGTSQYKTVTYYTLFKKIFGNITFPEVPTPEPGVDETLDTVTTRGNITANTIEVGGVTTNYTLYNTTYVAALQEGMTAWNDIDGTLDIRLKGNNVTLQVGQEEVIRVVNKTGANLLESQYRVVRVRTAAEGGAQGQRLAVLLAQANTKANHTGILGLVTENINNNQEGFVTAFGFIRNINTTGSLQGETWADGDALWLSATVAGGVTNVEPSQHPVQLGYVTYAHVNNGKIFVKLENGVDELGELHDVTFSTPPTNGQALVYNSSLSVWENQTISTGGVSGSGTATQVAFWNTSSSISSDSNLYWDNTLKNLGIGTATPIEKLVVSNAGAEGFEFQPSTGRFYRFDRVGMAYGGIYEEASEYTWSIGPSEKMRLDSSGNLGINTSSPTQLLDVRGDMSFGAGTNGMIYGPDGKRYIAYVDNFFTPGTTNLVIDPTGGGLGPYQIGYGIDPTFSFGLTARHIFGNGDIYSYGLIEGGFAIKSPTYYFTNPPFSGAIFLAGGVAGDEISYNIGLSAFDNPSSLAFELYVGTPVTALSSTIYMMGTMAALASNGYSLSIGNGAMSIDSSNNVYIPSTSLSINTYNTGYGNTKLTVYGDMTVGNASSGLMNFSLYGDDGYEYVEIKPSFFNPALTVLNLIPSPSPFMGPLAVGIGVDASTIAGAGEVLIVGSGNSVFLGSILAASVDASVLKQNGIKVDLIAITYAIALG